MIPEIKTKRKKTSSMTNTTICLKAFLEPHTEKWNRSTFQIVHIQGLIATPGRKYLLGKYNLNE